MAITKKQAYILLGTIENDMLRAEQLFLGAKTFVTIDDEPDQTRALEHIRSDAEDLMTCYGELIAKIDEYLAADLDSDEAAGTDADE